MKDMFIMLSFIIGVAFSASGQSVQINNRIFKKNNILFINKGSQQNEEFMHIFHDGMPTKSEFAMSDFIIDSIYYKNNSLFLKGRCLRLTKDKTRVDFNTILEIDIENAIKQKEVL